MEQAMRTLVPNLSRRSIFAALGLAAGAPVAVTAAAASMPPADTLEQVIAEFYAFCRDNKVRPVEYKGELTAWVSPGFERGFAARGILSRLAAFEQRLERFDEGPLTWAKHWRALDDIRDAKDKAEREEKRRRENEEWRAAHPPKPRKTRVAKPRVKAPKVAARAAG